MTILGVSNEIKNLPYLLETSCNIQTTSSLSAEANFSIANIFCLMADKQIIVLNAKSFFCLSEEFQIRFTSKIKNKYIFFVTDRLLNVDEISSYEILKNNKIFIAENDTICGTGNLAWYNNNLSNIKRFISVDKSHIDRSDISIFEDDIEDDI